MSHKIEKLNKTFMREISLILATELDDNKLKDVTITDVKISSDISVAKVYFRLLNDDFKDDATKSLNKASSFVKAKLFEKHNMKHIPKLNFVYDESIDYGNKIEKIIDELKNWHSKVECYN